MIRLLFVVAILAVGMRVALAVADKMQDVRAHAASVARAAE